MIASTLTFSEAIQRAGLTPPDGIEPGKLHRIPGDGKGRSNRAGWCKLFADGMGGVFGDWSTGLCETWQATRDKPLTKAERRELALQAEQAKAERGRIRKAEQAAAAIEAVRLYGVADKYARAREEPLHPYLARKCITAPAGVRQSGGFLLVPMTDAFTGKLRGLQSIDGGGAKRFSIGMGLTGCAFTFEPADNGPIAICEGFATGASIHAATAWRVVCAFTAHNLTNVANILRQRHPAARIVICADNDHGTERAGKGNAGMKAGRAAAKAVRGLLVAPPSDGGTDWNDYAQAHGVEALRIALCDAIRTTAAPASEAAA